MTVLKCTVLLLGAAQVCTEGECVSDADDALNLLQLRAGQLSTEELEGGDELGWALPTPPPVPPIDYDLLPRVVIDIKDTSYARDMSYNDRPDSCHLQGVVAPDDLGDRKPWDQSTFEAQGCDAFCGSGNAVVKNTCQSGVCKDSGTYMSSSSSWGRNPWTGQSMKYRVCPRKAVFCECECQDGKKCSDHKLTSYEHKTYKEVDGKPKLHGWRDTLDNVAYFSLKIGAAVGLPQAPGTCGVPGPYGDAVEMAFGEPSAIVSGGIAKSFVKGNPAGAWSATDTTAVLWGPCDVEHCTQLCNLQSKCDMFYIVPPGVYRGGCWFFHFREIKTEGSDVWAKTDPSEIETQEENWKHKAVPGQKYFIKTGVATPEQDRQEAEEAAQQAAEAKAAEAKARQEAEEAARKEAEAKAAEAKALQEAEEAAQQAAEAKARQEAEEAAQQAAEAKARQEAEEAAQQAAEAKALQEAEEAAQQAAEAKARQEAEEAAQQAAKAKARQEAEEEARKAACAVATWDGLEKVCGDCSALVNVRKNGKNCETYCQRQGLACVDAWDDEIDETCSLNAAHVGCLHDWTSTSDAICECAPEGSAAAKKAEEKKKEQKATKAAAKITKLVGKLEDALDAVDALDGPALRSARAKVTELQDRISAKLQD